MKAEIIAVGTELLLGQIVNTNAQFLSQGLAGLGIDVYFQTVVGDNEARLRQAIDIARSRADLLLFTGGLGPTQDDLTKDALAAYLGRGLVMHEPSMAKIEKLFASRGIHMVESNRRQALMIEGADPLDNETGLAVGNALTADGTHYVLLPGPPREMRPMFEGPAADWLQEITGDMKPLYSRILRFAGIGESSLEAALLPLIDGQSDPTIAPYAKEGEVALRISTKAADKAEAFARIDATVTQIEAVAGSYLYAREDVPIEQEVITLLRNTATTVATAESCSGGLLAELLTNVVGSSGAYAGGFVTYTNGMKHALLGIPMAQLEGPGAPGAISESTAALMAERTREIANTDYGAAITGVAGPAESEGKPVGLVYVAVAARGKPTQTFELQLNGNRSTIRIRAVKQALYRLWRTMGNV
ncbi:damage-inducible protein CinA [Paenibacillus darwinianus]|uniref:Putative competence-damage inducible protein n=1 Tax=Paenibacillus darwinianus TaxID=1380763 RepID=A0A9W5W7X6_9BACL|nr:competence/damage-inducible protein A [Paenibacillus darwinianus]EXX91146.1 damage-inducible protein CinA [Paenibacillus darwinianus]EXX92049.1 damage-inducible protein CinA [Paenibacillus darwinianus]EXX92765.1 damage-inducible protein CinA [Paenibacillus darwinianus]